MFSFSSFYKNSLDWVGQKRSQLLGAWRCVGCIPQCDRVQSDRVQSSPAEHLQPEKQDKQSWQGKGSSWTWQSQQLGPAQLALQTLQGCFGHHTQCPRCPSWLRVQARSEKIRIQPSEFSSRVGFAEVWVGVDRNPGQGWDKGGEGGEIDSLPYQAGRAGGCISSSPPGIDPPQCPPSSGKVTKKSMDPRVGMTQPCLDVFPICSFMASGIVSLEFLKTWFRCHSFKIIQRLFLILNLKEPVA